MSEKFLVVSIPGCPFCALVKQELRRRGLSFRETKYERAEDKARFKEAYNVTTFPQVFHLTKDGDDAPYAERIGGYEATVEWLNKEGL